MIVVLLVANYQKIYIYIIYIYTHIYTLQEDIKRLYITPHTQSSTNLLPAEVLIYLKVEVSLFSFLSSELWHASLVYFVKALSCHTAESWL